MDNEDTIEASSSGCVAKKRKISCGLECAAYGCGNTYYDSKGIRTTVHFFKFPAKNPDKNQFHIIHQMIRIRPEYQQIKVNTASEPAKTPSSIKIAHKYPRFHANRLFL